MITEGFVKTLYKIKFSSRLESMIIFLGDIISVILINWITNWIFKIICQNSSTLRIKKNKKIIVVKKIITNHKRLSLNQQQEICDWAIERGQNLVTRSNLKSCHELYSFNEPLNNLPYRASIGTLCYGCSNVCRSKHPVYLFSCVECGSLFQKNRNLTRDLTGSVAVVIGCRTKLGHQIVLKLLNAGCYVYGTTRFPERALEMFSVYPDYKADNKNWSTMLSFHRLDLDVPDILKNVSELSKKISEKHQYIDILVNSAAQTIRSREKFKDFNSVLKNRYDESKFAKNSLENSWTLEFDQICQNELEEVHRINSIGPYMVIQGLLHLMKASERRPYIINVSAKEGLFNVHKGSTHIHTNMAKASLAMLTACIRFKTYSGIQFSINGVCPGWISVDEYYEKERPWVIAPLDEIDGAARILYPLFKELSGSRKTRRHFHQLTY